MDTEPEELHVLDLAGIFRESFRILKSYSKLFASLTSTLILPLCFMLLAHHLVSSPLVHRIRRDESIIARHHGTPAAEQREEDLDQTWAKLLLFLTAYVIFVLAFSLLSTAAIVYSVACVYTEKSLSYVKVLSVVPRVWKRLLITFLWVFLIIFAFHAVSFLTIRLSVQFLADFNIFLFIVLLTLLVGFLIVLQIYLTCIWHLASVISVLEESYGIAALRRSVDLIKGKTALALCLFFIYLVCGGVIGFLFHFLVLRGHHHAHFTLLARFAWGAVLVTALSFVTLYGMLAQTVYYFACKSFHHEKIDWSALSEHLGAYLGEYVPLKGSIQMESFEDEVD